MPDDAYLVRFKLEVPERCGHLLEKLARVDDDQAALASANQLLQKAAGDDRFATASRQDVENASMRLQRRSNTREVVSLVWA